MPSATITSATIASSSVKPPARGSSPRRIAFLRDRQLAVEVAGQRKMPADAFTGDVEHERRDLAAREDHDLGLRVLLAVDRLEFFLKLHVLAIESERQHQLVADRMLGEQLVA